MEAHTQIWEAAEQEAEWGQQEPSPGARCAQSIFYPTCAAFLCIAQVPPGIINAIIPNFSSPQSNGGQFLASPGAF